MLSTTSLFPLAAFNCRGCRKAQIHYLKSRASCHFVSCYQQHQSPHICPAFHLQRFSTRGRAQRGNILFNKKLPQTASSSLRFSPSWWIVPVPLQQPVVTQTLRWMLATWGAAVLHNRTSASLSWWDFSAVMRHNSQIKHFPRKRGKKRRALVQVAVAFMWSHIIKLLSILVNRSTVALVCETHRPHSDLVLNLSLATGLLLNSAKSRCY